MAIDIQQKETTTPQQHIVEKAEAELQRLATAQRDIETRLPAIHEEMAALSQAAAQRVRELEDLRQILISLQTKENQAKSYALLAQGTPAEATAVKAMRTASRDRSGHENMLGKKEAAAARADQQDEKRLVELRAELETHTKELARLSQDRRAVEAARAQALAELGASVYEDVRTRVEQLQAEVSARRLALLDAQLELDCFLTDELPRLNHWPEHLEQVRQLAPNLEDGTSRALHSAGLYIDVLLAEAQSMAQHIGRSEATQTLRDWRWLLSIPHEEVWAAEQLNANPARLRARRDQIALALKDYRRHVLNAGRG